MQIHPVFQAYPYLYGELHIGSYEASLKLGLAVELLANVISEYTHKDVYRFLTDHDFRHSILDSKQNRQNNNNRHDRKVWKENYEREIGKKTWYKDSVEIIEQLINCAEAPPILENTREALVYHAIELSNQLLIPVRRYWTPDNHETIIKSKLLLLLSMYGIEFIDRYGYNSNPAIDEGIERIPYIHIRLPVLSFFDEQDYRICSIEIYLPKNELEILSLNALDMSGHRLAGSSDRPTR